MSTATGCGGVFTPTPTLDQRLAALKHANRIRVARSGLKALLREGQVSAWAVIDEPHHDYLTMKVRDVLQAQPQWGDTRTLKFMRRHAVSDVKTLGGLSHRQRAELVGALRQVAR